MKMEYPKQIQSKKAKVFYWCFTQELYFNLGRHFTGKVTNLTNDLAGLVILYTFLDWRLASLSIFGLTLIYFLGRFLIYKHNIDKVENLVNTARNPILKDVHSTIKEELKQKL